MQPPEITRLAGTGHAALTRADVVLLKVSHVHELSVSVALARETSASPLFE